MLRTNAELSNIKAENTFNNDLKKLFHAENYEVEINDEVYLSFRNNLRFDNKKERYDTKLPLKDYFELLPDNCNVAKHCLSSSKNKSYNNKDLSMSMIKLCRLHKERHCRNCTP